MRRPRGAPNALTFTVKDATKATDGDKTEVTYRDSCIRRNTKSRRRRDGLFMEPQPGYAPLAEIGRDVLGLTYVSLLT